MRDRRLAWLIVCLMAGPGVAHTDGPPSSEATEPDWPTAIAQLRQQLDRMPGHRAARQQLAIAYNNHGVALANRGQLEDAIGEIEEALRLDPANAQFSSNLATMYVRVAQQAFMQRQLQSAREALTRALAINPNEANAYALLGEVEYLSQRLKEARQAWGQALALKPDLMEVRDRLAQLDQELPVESKFEKLSQIYFDIRYTEALDRPEGFDIRDLLLQARRAVGSDFSYWPKEKLIVLIYSEEEFRKLRQSAPDWVAGQFDGKIRVPLPGRKLDQATVTRILYHEYTHAVVHDLTNGRCPTWLNEGLAEYEAWKSAAPLWMDLRHAIVSGSPLIPWTQLSDYFSLSRPAQDVSLAYQQSHSIAAYLAHRYGLWRIRRLLQAIQAGGQLEAVLTAEVHAKPRQLESEWRKWLDAELRTPGQR